jgi:hypothetical protein
MNRRELMLLLGGAMTAARALRAQQKATPVVGVLGLGSPGPFAPFVAALHQGLSETGYVEGQNVAIEYRWAEGHYDRLPALAADLERKVDVIAATGGNASARAAVPSWEAFGRRPSARADSSPGPASETLHLNGHSTFVLGMALVAPNASFEATRLNRRIGWSADLR